MRQLALGNKLVAEPSGALALAAAQTQDPDRRGTCVCLVTGGSVDAGTLADVLEQTP